jgi:hypothetical protein
MKYSIKMQDAKKYLDKGIVDSLSFGEYEAVLEKSRGQWREGEGVYAFFGARPNGVVFGVKPDETVQGL